MKILFAPMEGVAHYQYRSAQIACFRPADEYFLPFISPRNNTFSHRELQDVLPENNLGAPAIPQLLANDSKCFLWAAGELAQMGYREVNLNLGCPSGTVVSKHKGAGQLADVTALKEFLTEIFLHCPLSISLKTRLGMKDPGEFEPLLQLYSQFPLARLIVHPRVREDYYREPVRMEGFRQALAQIQGTLCYNGDLFTAQRLHDFQDEWPQVQQVMCGRGFLLHPGLMELWDGTGTETPERLRQFHDRLMENYQRDIGNATFVLCKMKEVWTWLGVGQNVSAKAMKRIRKADGYSRYNEAVAGAFEEMGG
ncbi:MAG: tRNA-dihydrouridine synthase family protein [Eubacteriales bacterium]|nr:tRNA-dihydrouridine synthase family protein [Eubacteriales bacterium]